MMFQGALGSLLNHRAVGHGVGERHTQLQHVCAGRDQRVHQRHGDRRLRISGSNVRDQGGTCLLL